jgi:peptidoglycan/LPS O-acetylase OafA/YrhL
MTESQRIEYVPALTGLRGVAAAAVLVFHCWQFAGGPRFDLPLVDYPLHALAGSGWLGVDLFFVLSGFLLAQPFLAANAGERRWPRLGNYVLRRARRVMPALWVQIVVLFVLGLVVEGMRRFDLATALGHGLFLAPLFPELPIVNPVYWSLPVEWWFYFALPVVCWVLGRSRWWLLLAFVLVSVVSFRLMCFHWLIDERGGPLSYPAIIGLGARWDQFVLGILAALAHRSIAPDGRLRALAFWGGIIALVAYVPWLFPRGDIYVQVDYPYVLVHQTVVATILAMIVFGAAGRVRAPTWLLGTAVPTWIGKISYSLYLWHYPLLEALQREGVYASLGPLVATGLAVGLSLALAWLSWWATERPFQRD